MTPEVQFIVGPQIPINTSDASGAGWFDTNQVNHGLDLAAAFPDEAHTPGNIPITGTVSVTTGSPTVTGQGTMFTRDSVVGGYAIISNGAKGRRIEYIKSIDSDTQLTLTRAWSGDTVSGQSIACPLGQDVDEYQGYKNYYDFVSVMRQTYERTQDSRFLDAFRKCADSWWSQPVIDYGKNYAFLNGEGLSPRVVALNGLMLRALDGRTEMWPWITDFVRNQYALWVTDMTGTASDRATYPSFYFGIRDGGFMLLYAANLAAVHPDPAVRSEFTTKALYGAVNYYARLQQTDGSFRWNDDGFPFTGTEQPFMVGILNEALMQVYKLTGNLTVKNAIIKSADHEYNHSYNRNWRGMYYFIHGTIGNPPIPCETGCGTASNPYPPSDTSQISDVRQLNATAIHQFGCAFILSGDAKFKTWGDEVFDATYSGNDGYRGDAWARGKEFDESYRAGTKYLGYRAGQIGTQPPASPLPDPAPVVPSGGGGGGGGTTTDLFATGRVLKDGVPQVGVKIVETDQFNGQPGDPIGATETDANGHYSLGYNPGQKGGIVGPTGYSPAYYLFDGSTNITGDFTLTTTPPPTTPTTRKIAEPKSEAAWNTLLDQQWAERYRLKKFEVGAWVTFEKV